MNIANTLDSQSHLMIAWKMLIEVEQYTLLYNETSSELWLYNEKRGVEEHHDVWKDQQ